MQLSRALSYNFELISLEGCRVCSHRNFYAASLAGPDRVLFLPSGLYDRSEVPEYLNGELAGE